MTATSLACLNKTVEDDYDYEDYNYEDTNQVQYEDVSKKSPKENVVSVEEMQQCRDRIESLLRYVLSTFKFNLFQYE